MKSRIYCGSTRHDRFEPVRHGFRYRIYWMGIDLEEIEKIGHSVRGFAYDRWALASIRAHDCGGPGPGGIRQRVLSILAESGIEAHGMRIVLMTIPRIFGYVFNPVSFYVCMDDDGRVQALLAEVRNTFGEVHHYTGAATEIGEPSEASTFTFKKRFYVSPFLDMGGTYFVRIQCTADCFLASISLVESGSRVFVARMEGRGAPLTSRSLFMTIVRMPFAAGSIMIKIQWQALILRLRRGVLTRVRPEPSDPATIRAPRSSVWYWLRDRLVRYASKTSGQRGGNSTVEDDPKQ